MIIQAESFTKALSELVPLLYAHSKEVALFPDSLMTFAPNWQYYVMKERTGELLLIVARDGGAIVGYYMAFVYPCPHYSTTLRATYDNMRVLPDYRQKGLGMLLLTKAEEELKKRGVQIWHSGSRVGESYEPMNKLLAKAGFKPADLFHAKWIG